MTLMVTVLLALMLLSPCVSLNYILESNDRVLFVGHMNAMLGSLPHGFVNIFGREANSVLQNVSVFTAGAEANLDLLVKLDTLLDHYKPTIVVVSLGIEAFSGRGTLESLGEIKYEVESIVARLLQEGQKVILCPMAFSGERTDSSNGLDEVLGEYAQVNKQIARDYAVMGVNLSNEVGRYLQANNVDNQQHSVLTLEGSVLNERGHMLAALVLLRALGVTGHSLASDDLLVQEERRVQALKRELSRVAPLDLESVDVSI
ncbi:hypothetical protein B484DRAFT_400093 [Ochromonadaceae sp. CCMP2298]|nr:hypothetical protein B484DRAFT_400093 [Ochromonadaceae sp. CCMP2298]